MSSGSSRRAFLAGAVAVAAAVALAWSMTAREFAAAAPRFDGARALEDVARVVALGPRPPGSEAHRMTEALIAGTLRGLGLKPTMQRFVARTPAGPVPEVNIQCTVPANVEPSAPDFVMVATHYDTKIFRRFAFVGANDGGSGTGALLELARVLVTAPRRPRPVVLAFLDGEEAVRAWSATDSCYGSRHLAAAMRQDGTRRNLRAFILLDMIGDRELDLVQDAYSTPWLRGMLWQEASRLGYRRFFTDHSMGVEDDHLPFLALGVPSVDLIDFTYGPHGTNVWWHTGEDTMDKLSASSLQVVGRVVEQTVLDLTARGAAAR